MTGVISKAPFTLLEIVGADISFIRQQPITALLFGVLRFYGMYRCSKKQLRTLSLFFSSIWTLPFSFANVVRYTQLQSIFYI